MEGRQCDTVGKLTSNRRRHLRLFFASHYVSSALRKHRRTAARDGIKNRNFFKTGRALKYLCPGSKYNLNATQCSHYNAYMLSRTPLRSEFWSRVSRLFHPEFTYARGLPRHRYALKCERRVAFDVCLGTNRLRFVCTST